VAGLNRACQNVSNLVAGRQLSRIELCDISHINYYMASHACAVPHHLCACARAPVRPKRVHIAHSYLSVKFESMMLQMLMFLRSECSWLSSLSSS
jgi:hypothetical protein